MSDACRWMHAPALRASQCKPGSWRSLALARPRVSSRPPFRGWRDRRDWCDTTQSPTNPRPGRPPHRPLQIDMQKPASTVPTRALSRNEKESITSGYDDSEQRRAGRKGTRCATCAAHLVLMGLHPAELSSSTSLTDPESDIDTRSLRGESPSASIPELPSSCATETRARRPECARVKRW